MKYCENSIRSKYSTNEEILRAICENTLKTRPARDVQYTPYTETAFIPDKLLVGIDFKDVFSDFEDGDFVFMACGYEAIHDREMLYNLFKYSDYELYFNGEKKEKKEYKDGTMDSEIIMKQGENLALMKVIAKNGEFKAVPRTILPESHYAGYGYNVREFIPLEGFKKQRGVAFSRLYKKGEEVKAEMDSIEWIFPELPVQTNIKTFDFSELCKSGKAAYAYTVFSGKIALKHDSPLKLFANKKEIYSADKGTAEFEFKETTELLFKSGRGDSNWGFEAESEGTHSMPMANTDDHDDLHWIWIGPFGREEEPFSHPYPPEHEITFEEPYPSIHGARVYWNFYRKNTIMVQALNTNSFGNWMYACMVGAYFLKKTADKLDIPEVNDYFMKSINTISTRREYAIYENIKYGYSALQNSSATLSNLDAIGTFGMNIAEYYLMTGSKDARRMLHILAEKVENNIPRFPDGTYHRVKTMWTDDMFMCLPFLVRLGVIFNEKKYLDEVYRQVVGYYDRMFMKDQGIYSHIYYPEEEVANRIPWGRGNGWVLLALSEVLLLMPEEYEGRERILEIFREFSKGVLKWRDKKEGIWHQVVNNHESYIETSGSSMFIIALARGVRKGWIDDCREDIIEAWEALTEKCVDSEGNVYGVCMGSSCSKEEEYYMQLGTIKNDDHGIGVVMGAGVETMNLLGE